MSEHDDILADQIAQATERMVRNTRIIDHDGQGSVTTGLELEPDPAARIAELEARVDALEALFKALNAQLLHLSLSASVALAKQGE